MTDNRFPSVGVDARFPAPVGTDVRFPSPGEDLEHLPDGTDTRFEGGTYGGGGGGPTLSEQVEAILSGTGGFALDPSDLSTLDQISTGGTPVTTIGDPVGRMTSKWGTTPRLFINATGAQRPAWNGAGGLTLDGTDDRLSLASFDGLQNVPAAFFAGRIKPAAMTGLHYPLWVSTVLAGNPRFAFYIRNDPGSANQLRRRADADASTQINVAGSQAVVGVEYTFSSEVDYVGGGANIWKDGVLIGNNTLAGSGNTENTASAAASYGIGPGSGLFNGVLGRMVVCPFIPSTDQRATIEAWCAEVAL